MRIRVIENEPDLLSKTGSSLFRADPVVRIDAD